MQPKPLDADVAIIGAGLAGAAAASALADQGKSVIVIEKSRGAGGRMSTRRTGDLTFDHGAQYFTARDAAFAQQVERWQQAGVAASWLARIGVISETGVTGAGSSMTRFVGVPGMNAPCKQLLDDRINCRYQWTVESARQCADHWLVADGHGAEIAAGALICTAPPSQGRDLVAHNDARAALAGIQLKPCWALLAQFQRPLLRDWDAAFVNHGPLAWIASQNSRPQRPSAHSWVLHASPAWSLKHLEAPPERVAGALLRASFELPGADASAVAFQIAHRWRYSIADEPRAEGAIGFAADKLVLAGDWCSGSRVEGAWLSGKAAARCILDQQDQYML